MDETEANDDDDDLSPSPSSSSATSSRRIEGDTVERSGSSAEMKAIVGGRHDPNSKFPLGVQGHKVNPVVHFLCSAKRACHSCGPPFDKYKGKVSQRMNKLKVLIMPVRISWF